MRVAERPGGYGKKTYGYHRGGQHSLAFTNALVLSYFFRLWLGYEALERLRGAGSKSFEKLG